MNTRSLLMMVFTCFLPSICALKDNFNFPYYFLLGGIENSVDQPFVSIHIHTLRKTKIALKQNK